MLFVGQAADRIRSRGFAPGHERPVFGGVQKFDSDPHWRDHLLFYEYFHGDNGAGIGASHQTGWTGVVARLIQLYGSMTGAGFLEGGVRPEIKSGETPRGPSKPRAARRQK